MRRRRLISSMVTVVAALWAAPAWSVELNSAGGFLFDIDDSGQGVLNNGTIDAYDSCYSLRVNDNIYSADRAGEVAGRLVTMAEMTMGPVKVSRRILVPDEAGRDYARYIDTFENPGTSPVTVQVGYFGNLGSDEGTTVWASSSGDLLVAHNDHWFGTDDEDGDGDPTLAHVFSSEGGRVTPESVSLTSDNIEVGFALEVAAGQAVSVMFFALQGPNQSEVREQVSAILVDPGAAMADLSPAEVERIANFPTIGGLPILGEHDLIAGQEDPEPAYQASMRLQVATAEEPMRRAVEIAEELGGRIERQQSTMVVLRVPVEHFRTALDRLETLGYVLGRSVRIQAGSERVRDLQIRLRSAQEVRTRLMQLARRSPSTSEAVAIERQIERLNLLIEQLQSYLDELEERARFSIIELRFQETRRVESIPRNLWQLPFSWIDELGLDNLLNVD